MQKKEIAQLLTLNMVIYKASKLYSEAELKLLVDVWHEHFKDYDYAVIKQAFNNATTKSQFFILPADIFRELTLLAKEQQMSGTEQFQQLLETHRKVQRWIGDARDFPNQIVQGSDKTFREIRDNRTKKAFNNLSLATQSYLVNWQGLLDLATYSKEDIETYRRTDFLRHCDSFVDVHNLGFNNLTIVAREMVRLG